MSISLTFLGAAQNVTGSCYAAAADASTVLVDCGLYQERDLRLRNWAPFPLPPARIAAVLLTHAHLDHCGLLPKLVREGFGGKIFCTPATAELAKIVLLDSAKIQEEDAAAKARRHAAEGRQGSYPDVPLYSIADAEAVLPRLMPVAYGKSQLVALGIQAEFHEAGHILGSAMVKLNLRAANAARSVLFTGDLGRCHLPILRDPAESVSADALVIESTYGDRCHDALDDIPAKLAEILNATARAGGKVIIPAFAIERTQEIIYYLNLLLKAGKIPRIPVYVDSPMAAKTSEVFRHHPELFDEETLALTRAGHPPYEYPGMTWTVSVEESKTIDQARGPLIVVAGSGMCTGGRIKFHLAEGISAPQNTVLFVGYQAQGTLGREILEGAKEVRILGNRYPVRARIAQLNGFSAHADRNEMLTWLRARPQAPRQVFVTHGEAATAVAFAAFVREKTGWPAAAPAYNQREELD
jgi:metallo-beta-lactamase family protein